MSYSNYYVCVFKKYENKIYKFDISGDEILFFKYEKENNGYYEYNLKHIFNYYVVKNKDTNRYELYLKIHGQYEPFFKKQLFEYHIIKCGKYIYLNEDLFNNDYNNDFENELFYNLLDGYNSICSDD
jgi:hypothetical protein